MSIASYFAIIGTRHTGLDKAVYVLGVLRNCFAVVYQIRNARQGRLRIGMTDLRADKRRENVEIDKRRLLTHHVGHEFGPVHRRDPFGGHGEDGGPGGS